MVIFFKQTLGNALSRSLPGLDLYKTRDMILPIIRLSTSLTLTGRTPGFLLSERNLQKV